MSKTYTTIGINLKGMSMGENDRLLTILTSEHGLIRAIAPGSRKINSILSGRSNLFVINELLIVKGRSIDKIIQAETVKTYPHLTTSLGQLAISQYLAELVLCQSLIGQPQPEIYSIFCYYLQLLEELKIITTNQLLKYLCKGIFQLLNVGGISPQVNSCCLTKKFISPDQLTKDILIPFSMDSGGIMIPNVKEIDPNIKISDRINPLELALLQSLTTEIDHNLWRTVAKDELEIAWRKLENLLRNYIYYHLGVTIRSSSLLSVI